eukprot:scaffold65593_cov63-Phaeocystis_antarctica.AAC.1
MLRHEQEHDDTAEDGHTQDDAKPLRCQDVGEVGDDDGEDLDAKHDEVGRCALGKRLRLGKQLESWRRRHARKQSREADSEEGEILAARAEAYADAPKGEAEREEAEQHEELEVTHEVTVGQHSRDRPTYATSQCPVSGGYMGKWLYGRCLCDGPTDGVGYAGAEGEQVTLVSLELLG